MAENNNQNNRRKNVTGSYKGVTGSYKSPSAHSSYVNNRSDATTLFDKAKPGTKKAPERKEPTKIYTQKNARKPQQDAPKRSDTLRQRETQNSKKSFDWKAWFSKDNVKGFLREVRFYGIIVVISLLFTWGIVSVANDVFAFIKPADTIVVSIPEGSNTEAIAKVLKQDKVIKHPFVFRLYCKLKKAEGKFQYGDYSLGADYSYDMIISKLKKASVQAETVTLTIPVGATQDEIVKILTAGKYTNITDLEYALNEYEFKNYEFVSKLPDRRCRLEGYLPAGDYELYKGESAVSIISKMLARFEETILTEENKALITATGKSLDTLVTTASLVYAECDNKEHYKTVASVIANRLSMPENRYLCLTSPINYVLPERKQILTATEMNTASTYNTYLYEGLPTGPVCTPSAEAFVAVISPESTAYNYFISDGQKTVFSSTAEEHTKALADMPKTVKGTEVIR